MEKKFILIVLATLGIALAGSFYNTDSDDSFDLTVEENEKNHPKIQSENKEKISYNKKSNNNGKIVVYIEGAIAKPGLVYLNDDARLGEAVELSGGLLANADVENLNMADKLTDGEKITIPQKNKATNLTESSSEEKSDVININTASAEELQKLPRVGAVTAKNIIEYREKHGKFKTIDEIKNVPRIGEKTFEKFKDKIKI